MDKKVLISETALKRAIGKFGFPKVADALSSAKDWRLRHKTFGAWLRDFESDADLRRNRIELSLVPVLREMVQDSSEAQSDLAALVLKVNGVSEPATVPHQTPEARVTPGGGEDEGP